MYRPQSWRPGFTLAHIPVWEMAHAITLGLFVCFNRVCMCMILSDIGHEFRFPEKALAPGWDACEYHSCSEHICLTSSICPLYVNQALWSSWLVSTLFLLFQPPPPILGRFLNHPRPGMAPLLYSDNQCPYLLGLRWGLKRVRHGNPWKRCWPRVGAPYKVAMEIIY